MPKQERECASMEGRQTPCQTIWWHSEASHTRAAVHSETEGYHWFLPQPVNKIQQN